MMSRLHCRAALFAGAVLATATATARGQDAGAGMTSDSGMPGMHQAMAGHLADGPHMRMTPLSAPKPDDAARAAAVIQTLRAALAPYADYHRALADGFTVFAPRLPQQIYHFTKRSGFFVRTLSFDPARPTSLLYVRTADNTYRLVGAMYTAPRWASLADLDARVPLSVTQWHEHVNLCVPAGQRDPAQWMARDSTGRLLFGTRGTIATASACQAAGGRFIPHFLGWMVHVYPFASDTAAVWGRGDADHM